MESPASRSADFANNGSSAISFGTIMETTPGVFTVEVTPTSLGTLRVQIATGASINDAAGLALITSPAIVDDPNVPAASPGSATSYPVPASASPREFYRIGLR